MSYVPHTPIERAEMCEAVGVSEMEELFDDVPDAVRFPDLNLPQATTELELAVEVGRLAAKNTPVEKGATFLGAGTYNHFIPSTVDSVLRRGEFFTAYTPYQPELSQGMLQAMFEYQSMVCQLTDMEVSNASHYDGSTALAEAVLLALDVTKGRDKVVFSPYVHPQYRAVVRTYLRGTDAALVGCDEGRSEMDQLASALDDRTAALVIQSPNFLGHFEEVEGLAEAVHEVGGLLIVVADPISLGLFRSPGSYGADVVVADGQPLGVPPSFGGPHLGIFATRRSYVRRLPGRLVGETLDRSGRRGYVLTLSTREQHIRRARATSNICTNSGLTALAAAVYLATMGKAGLRRAAELCYQRSHYAAKRIGALEGFEVNPHAPDQPFFKEFVVQLPAPVEHVNRVLLEEHGILGGYDLGQDYAHLGQHMLVAVTEMNTRADIDRLVDALEVLRPGANG